jgi:chromosome segregation ATPase
LARQTVHHNTDAIRDGEAVSSAPSDREKPLPVTASELRAMSARRQLFAGYRRRDADRLRERAAATIDDLTRKLHLLQSTVAELKAAHATLEERLAQTVPRTAQEVAGEMFDTAYRAIQTVKEDARLAAEQVVADALARTENSRTAAEQLIAEARTQAEGLLAEATAARGASEQLRDEAHATLEEAQREALELHHSVEAERTRLIAEWVASADEIRHALETEKASLEHAVAELRGEWVGFISDALNRLEAIAPGVTPHPEQENPSETPTEAQAVMEESVPEPPVADVVADLHERLHDGSSDSRRSL